MTYYRVKYDSFFLTVRLQNNKRGGGTDEHIRHREAKLDFCNYLPSLPQNPTTSPPKKIYNVENTPILYELETITG
jgi:hypothetical protein